MALVDSQHLGQYRDRDESARLYRLIAETIPHIVWTAGADGGVEYLNRRCCEYTGVPARELEGWGWKAVVHPEDWERTLSAWTRALQSGERYDAELRLRRADGTYRWHHASAVPLSDENGHVQRWFGTATDIEHDVRSARILEDMVDERTRALRENEARFRSLTELSSDWYWEQDEELRFTRFEGRVSEISGKRPESALGRRRWELDAITPLSSTWDEHRAVLEARRPFRDFEYARVGDDGVVRYIAVSGEPVYDAEGRFRGYRGLAADISPRKRAEQALRESEARFRSLAALSSDYYWETDAEYRFTEMVFGPRVGIALPVERQLGSRRWEIPYASPAEEVWAAHRAMLEARLPFSDFELSRIVPGGEERWYTVSGEPVFDEAGDFTGYRGVGSEITERKRAEHALRESERRFQLFMDNMPALAWIKDAGFRYTYANAMHERVRGRKLAQLRGRDDFELWPAGLAQQFRSSDEAALRAAQDAVQALQTVPFPDGRPGHWLVVRFGLPGASGEAGVAGIEVDVTARIEAEDKVRGYAADIRRLMNRLVAAQEAERRRVAGDLHDLIGQNLTALGLSLSTLKRGLPAQGLAGASRTLDSMAALIERTIDAIRGVMTELRPPALQNYGLVAALREYAAEFGERTGIKVSVSAPRFGRRLPQEAELALFRVAQEALTNAAKHSGAASVGISLTEDAGRIGLVVEDDGRGFAEPQGARRARRGGWGLPAMRERAEAHGGSLRIEFPGRGTRVIVEIPGSHGD